MHTENLCTLFDRDALRCKSAEELVAELSDPMLASGVECVLYSTMFSHEQFSLFSPEVGGYGTPLQLPTGELFYMRMRACIGTSPFAVRGREPFVPNETREIVTVVVGASRKSGVHYRLVATKYDLQNDAPLALGSLREARTRACYGCNVAPLLFVDQHVPNTKGTSINGFGTVFCGSASFVDGIDCEKKVPLCSSVIRGFGSLTTAEWVSGARLEKRSVDHVALTSREDFNKQWTRATTRVDRALAERRAEQIHHASLPVETVACMQEALSMAYFVLEHATLGGLVDHIATDAYVGVSVPFFEIPTRFALYLSAAVLIAATPEMAHLPCAPEIAHEDMCNARTLMDLFHSLTSGVDEASGIRCTAIEAVLNVACDSIRSGIETESRIPQAIELMRRQGAALLQELWSLPGKPTEDMSLERTKARLGDAEAMEALNRISDPMGRLIGAERRAAGSVGSWAQNANERRRRATRAARQGVVLKTLLEINEFCTTGMFHGRRFACENTQLDNHRNGGPACGIPRNRVACNSVHDALSVFFVLGPEQCVYDGSPLCFPLRPRTRARCGGCGSVFDPRLCISRLLFGACGGCKRLFCGSCYQAFVDQLAKQAEHANLGHDVLQRISEGALCRQCAANAPRSPK